MAIRRLCGSRGRALGLCLGVALALGGCGRAPRPEVAAGRAETGLASYYTSAFQDRTTASGEKYDENALTAAHRTLPFGTRVRVTRLETGRSVLVRINDRGPWKEGRVIDLSRAAADSLGMIEEGLTRVRIEVR